MFKVKGYAIFLRTYGHPLSVGYATYIKLVVLLPEDKTKVLKTALLWENGSKEFEGLNIRLVVDRYFKTMFRDLDGTDKFFPFSKKEQLGWMAKDINTVDYIYERAIKDLQDPTPETMTNMAITLGLQKGEYTPEVIVCKEKHGDNMYLARNPTEGGDIYLSILNDRFKDGLYDWMKDFKTHVKKPKFTREEIEQLPPSMLDKKMELHKELLAYEKENKEALAEKERYENIKKALKTGDPYLAQSLIKEMGEGEYEQVTTETFCRFDNLTKVKKENLVNTKILEQLNEAIKQNG